MAAAAGAGSEPVDIEITDYTSYFKKITGIIEEGHTENVYSKKIQDFITDYKARNDINVTLGQDSNSEIFSKKQIRYNLYFFNIMLFLVKKLLYSKKISGRISSRRSSDYLGENIKWINFILTTN
jgi:hypothetical protein